MVGIKKGLDICEYNDAESLQEAALQFVETHLKSATADRNKTTLFLSGGSTPGPVYSRLSEIKLPWSRVHVAQVDDRWVPLADPGSNARLIKKTILRNKAANAKFVRLKSRHRSATAGQEEINTLYSKLPMANSLAILGMGSDGHVCSWFPDAVGLSDAIDPDNENLVQAIQAIRSNVTGAYLERITLTLSALNQCVAWLLLITGEEKRKVLEQAIADPSSDLPVAHLLRASKGRLTIMTTGA